jgi:hypothetical protein
MTVHGMREIEDLIDNAHFALIHHSGEQVDVVKVSDLLDALGWNGEAYREQRDRDYQAARGRLVVDCARCHVGVNASDNKVGRDLIEWFNVRHQHDGPGWDLSGEYGVDWLGGKQP